jgi:hypothetical protein
MVARFPVGRNVKRLQTDLYRDGNVECSPKCLHHRNGSQDVAFEKRGAVATLLRAALWTPKVDIHSIAASLHAQPRGRHGGRVAPCKLNKQRPVVAVVTAVGVEFVVVHTSIDLSG